MIGFHFTPSESPGPVLSGKLEGLETFPHSADFSLDEPAGTFELHNLAIVPKKTGDLLMAMKAKLNRLGDAEGEDVGPTPPGGVDGVQASTAAARDL